MNTQLDWMSLPKYLCFMVVYERECMLECDVKSYLSTSSIVSSVTRMGDSISEWGGLNLKEVVRCEGNLQGEP